jgi:hypothetical protein
VYAESGRDLRAGGHADALRFTEAEAIELANDVDLWLVGHGLDQSDLNRSMRVSQALDAGRGVGQHLVDARLANTRSAG